MKTLKYLYITFVLLIAFYLSGDNTNYLETFNTFVIGSICYIIINAILLIRNFNKI